ncbi:Calcium channel yvc1 [Rhodotorula kratochvilovae]
MANDDTGGLLGDMEESLATFTGGRNNKPEHAHLFHPKTVSRIVTRIEALTLELLPIQVDLGEIMSPTSSIITKDVIEAFGSIAGDFHACLPFALLEARRYFARQQRLNPSDSDENAGRKLACEAIARKLVARTPIAEQYSLLSKRFTVIESDGDESMPLSALESAVDQHATFFLSSNEAQRCVFALWKGLLVQKQMDDGNIEYQLYKAGADQQGFLAHFETSRIAVPRYQFFLRVFFWIIFVVSYTIAIQTPERGFGIEDGVLYIQLLGYLLEDLVKIYKIGWWACVSFWQVINFAIYSLAAVAFVYRCFDLGTLDETKQAHYRMLSFQFLSVAAPLVWTKLLTVFDPLHFFGVMLYVVWRMLKESAVFCALLAIFAIGFGQALTGLDVADERRESTKSVINSLLQAFLGSPNFEMYDKGEKVGDSSYPFGLIVYYLWSVMTLVILLNVLVALFSSSYQECVDESEPTFLAFFAGKTVSSIRAPDSYPYPAPFNLVELFIIPLEFVVSRETYARINRVLMGTLFFFPLWCISLFETRISPLRQSDLEDLLREPDDFQSPEEDPEPYRNAEGDDDPDNGEPEGMKICRVSFKELKERMPNLERSVEGQILYEVLELKSQLTALRAELAELRDQQGKADKLNGKAGKVKQEAREAKAAEEE